MLSTEVARALSPRGDVTLHRRLRDHVEVLELRVNGVFVMDTVETTSERALATRALAMIDDPAHVLVGGLGLGYTLAEVLADARVQQVTCVELEESLVTWMGDGTVPHGPALLRDPRIRLVTGDVADVLARAEAATYDLVLLDVDNGPGYLVHDHNAGLYEASFLEVAARATRGHLVIWSAAAAPELATALEQVVGNCTPVPYAVRLGRRDETYWLYAASTGHAALDRVSPLR